MEKIIQEYIAKGDYFAPDYERENEVLENFHRAYSSLTNQHTDKLRSILEEKSNDWDRKFFVADLLYYYKEFDQSLIAPMLKCAIDYQDPSFNRIFLRPCLMAHNDKSVVELLTIKFRSGNFKASLLA